MKVKELIEQLQKLPQDLDVVNKEGYEYYIYSEVPHVCSVETIDIYDYKSDKLYTRVVIL